jgi:hypothetical protein
VAGGTKIATSEDPTALNAGWQPATFSGANLTSVSCPTATFCAASSSFSVLLSTDPAGGFASWFAVQPLDGGGGGLNAISCPNEALCVAVDDTGNVLATGIPDIAGTWHKAHLTRRPLTAVSCGTQRLCVASDEFGQLFVSTDPLGGAGAWHAVHLPEAGLDFNAVDCVRALECLAFAGREGVVASSSRPSDASAPWRVRRVTGAGDFPSPTPTGLSCPTGGFCAALNGVDGTVATSTHPRSGAAAWRRGLADPHQLLGIACPLPGFCVGVDSHGDVVRRTAG